MQKWHDGLPAAAEDVDERGRRDHPRLAAANRPPVRVAGRRPPQQLASPDEPWLAVLEHERAVGEIRQHAAVQPALGAVEALVVKSPVDRVRSDAFGM